MDSKFCSGCGITLQNESHDKSGFVKNLKISDYCIRCYKLEHYGNVYVDDFNIDNAKQKIIDIIDKSDLNDCFFYVIDIFDFYGSRIFDIEEHLKNKNVYIIFNKVDILPMKFNTLKFYLNEKIGEIKINNLKYIACSKKNKASIIELLNLLKFNNFNNYFIGASKTGKSTIINNLIQASESNQNKVISSRYLNTTQDIIEINLNIKNKVYDTPGIMISKTLLNAIDINNWNKFEFKNTLKQFTFQLSSKNSVVIEGFCWVSVLFSDPNEKFSLHFWINKLNKIHRTKTLNINNYLKKLTPNFIKPVINEFENHEFLFNSNKETSIIISGIGYISLKPTKDLKLIINVPKINNSICVYKQNKII